MILKIYIALVALCIAQDLNVRAAPNKTPRISNEDSIKVLNELINKIQNSISNFEDIIQNYDNKIKEDLDKINISDIIAMLETMIEEIGNKSEASLTDIFKCLNEAQPALKDLKHTASKGLDDCLISTRGNKNKIIKILTEISIQAANTIASITDKIIKCTTMQSDKFDDCFKSLIEPSTQQVISILNKVKTAIEESNKLTESADREVVSCVSKVQTSIVFKEKEILNHFKSCINV